MDSAVRKIRDYFNKIEADADVNDDDMESSLEPLEQINRILEFDRLETHSVVTESQPSTAVKERPVPLIPLDKIKKAVPPIDVD